MKSRVLILIVSCILILLMLACGTSNELTNPPAGSPDSNQSASETADALAAQSAQIEATNVAIQATNQALLDTQATLLAPTETPEDPFAGEDYQGEEIPSDPEMVEITTEARERLQPLFDEGLLSEYDLETAEYYRLDDFDESWAQINWYQWWNTGYQPQNFIIRVDSAWETASNTANWFSSGCGFVYAEDGEENHYMTFLALDGNVHTFRNLKGQFTEMKGGYYGKVGTPDGDAELLLMVKDQYITFIVDGRKVVRFQDPNLTAGNLGLTLNSGTNKDYGFRCMMTDIDLWILAE